MSKANCCWRTASTGSISETEEILKDGVDMIIFCSPTIPWGEVWTREETETLLAWQINTVLSS